MKDTTSKTNVILHEFGEWYMYRHSHVYTLEGKKILMNCHGDKIWDEVAIVTEMFLKGHITLAK